MLGDGKLRMETGSESGSGPGQGWYHSCMRWKFYEPCLTSDWLVIALGCEAHCKRGIQAML